MRNFLHRTFASLKIRNYRLYFIGQAISYSGTWMQAISQDWLVLKMTNSGIALGTVVAVQFFPMLILGPWGGVIVDRFPKRKILYFTQTVAGILAFILGFLVWTNLVQLWMVYVLALFLGLINAVDYPARQAFVIDMVGKEELPNAVALNAVQTNLARVIGPSFAGIIIASLGLAICFIINGISYLAVLIVLFMMREEEFHAAPLSSGDKGQFIKGIRYVLSQPLLTETLIMMVIIGTLTYEFSISLPLLAQFTFNAGAGGFAALTAAMGLGSVAGGLYIAGQKKASLEKLIGVAFFYGITILIAAVMPNLFLAVAAMVAVGVFSIIFMSLGNVILQLESDPQMRGRVMSLWAVAFLGTTSIGGPIIGWIGEYIGPRWGLGVGGVAAILAAGFGYFAYKNKLEMGGTSKI